MNGLHKKYLDFLNNTQEREFKLANLDLSNSYDIRHSCYFSDYDLENKKILDIGCNAGILGAWVLDNGANFYQGLEIDKSLSDTAKSNLSKYFKNYNWNIKQEDGENFLHENKEYYDLIVLGGIVQAFSNPIEILNKVVKSTDNIIIDSAHPTKFWKRTNELSIGNELEEIPFISYEYSRTYPEDYWTYQFFPSISFYTKYLGEKSFYPKNVNNLLKKNLSKVYNIKNRFAERYSKNG